MLKRSLCASMAKTYGSPSTIACLWAVLSVTAIPLVFGQSGTTPTRHLLTPSDSVDSVRPAVVRVRVAYQGYQAASQGTGFIVNRGAYVVTADHVISAPLGQPVKSLWVDLYLTNRDSAGASIRGMSIGVSAKVVAEDAQHDVALLKMEQNPFNGEVSVTKAIDDKHHRVGLTVGTPAFRTTRPKEGIQIALSGYPVIGSPDLLTTFGSIASSWGVSREAVRPPGASAWMPFNDLTDVYLANIVVNSGNSGGPVYEIDTGKIIGICRAYLDAAVNNRDEQGQQVSTSLIYNSGIAQVVPIKFALDLMAKHGVVPDEHRSSLTIH